MYCDGYSSPVLLIPSDPLGAPQDTQVHPQALALVAAVSLWFRLSVCGLLWVPRKPRHKLPRNRALKPKRKPTWAPFIIYA